MGADIVEYVDQKFRSGNSVPIDRAWLSADEWAQLRAEIGRLRGEVAELKARRSEDVSILDDIRDAIGGGPYDTIAKRIRQDIAPAEANGDLSALERLAWNWKNIDVPLGDVGSSATLERCANELRAVIATMTTPQPADGEAVAELVAAANNLRANIGFRIDDPRDAMLQRLHAACASFSSPCNCPGGNKPANLHAPNCPFRTTPPAAQVQAAPQEECASCETEGVFATDGSGPFNCYACGKKVANPAAVPAGEAVAYSVVQIGNRGAAYDPPNTHRAFTYEHQPGNIDASRLGRATNAAAVASAGDSIDRGLSLLKELQALGFGVFQIGPPAPVQAAPQEWEALRLIALIDAEISYNRNRVVGGRWSVELDEARKIAVALAAHPSACELGAVRELVKVWRVAVNSASTTNKQDLRPERFIRELEAALQHRGDSQEVWRG